MLKLRSRLCQQDIDLISKIAEQSPLASTEDILLWILNKETQIWDLKKGSASGILLTAVQGDAVIVEGIAGSGGVLQHVEEIVEDLSAYTKIVRASRLLAYAKPWVEKRLINWEHLLSVMEKKL